MYSFMYHCMTIYTAVYATIILEYTEETYRSNICNCIFCCRSVLKNIRICRRLQAIKTRMMHWTRDHSFRGQWLFQYKQNQQANLQNSQTSPDLVELESSSAQFFCATKIYLPSIVQHTSNIIQPGPNDIRPASFHCQQLQTLLHLSHLSMLQLHAYDQDTMITITVVFCWQPCATKIKYIYCI